MITIELIGLDMFETKKYSQKHGQSIAKEFGVSVNDIYYIANEGAIFNNGTEQGAWNVAIKVFAPRKFEKVEKVVADKILSTITEIVIHAHLIFDYYDESHSYRKLNDKYPLFLETPEDDFDDENYEEGCDCGENCECGEECDCEHDCGCSDDDEDENGEFKCCCHKNV